MIAGKAVTVPDRIARLPRDRHGYPIPWNVLKADDGTPFFIVNDDRRHFEAIRKSLCPLCGERLGRSKWFVGGPQSAFDERGWYIDLPGHRDCMRFALSVCPYLAAPRYLRATDAIAHMDKLPPEARILIDETVSPERPEVFVAVASDKMEVESHGPMLPYVRPARPFLDYEFWRHGQQIPQHRAMPVLRGIFGADWMPPEKRA